MHTAGVEDRGMARSLHGSAAPRHRAPGPDGWRRVGPRIAVRAVLAALAIGTALAAPAGPAFAFEDAEVRAIVGHQVDPAEYQGAGGVWMARQRHVEIDGGGNGRITEHLIARVFDAGWGAERFGPWRRTWAAEQSTKLRVIRARVWTSRTEFTDLPPEAVKEQGAAPAGGCAAVPWMRETIIRFPALEPGQVIELLLRTAAPLPHYERNARWAEETFGAEDPVVEQQFMVTLPAAARLDTALVGTPIRPAVRAFEGYRRYTWMTGNLPAAGARYVETTWARYPQWPDSVTAAFPRISVGTLGDWNWAGRNYGEGWEVGWRTPGDASELAFRIVRQTSDPFERARAIEALVQDSIATVPVEAADLLPRPALPAAEVARVRCGTAREKACLLVALLRAAGVEAVPVLVRQRPGPLIEAAPGLSQFDRWLARARIGTMEMWYDPVESATAIPAGRGLLLPGPSDPAALREAGGLVAYPGRPVR